MHTHIYVHIYTHICMHEYMYLLVHMSIVPAEVREVVVSPRTGVIGSCKLPYLDRKN